MNGIEGAHSPRGAPRACTRSQASISCRHLSVSSQGISLSLSLSLSLPHKSTYVRPSCTLHRLRFTLPGASVALYGVSLLVRRGSLSLSLSLSLFLHRPPGVGEAPIRPHWYRATRKRERETFNSLPFSFKGAIVTIGEPARTFSKDGQAVGFSPFTGRRQCRHDPE